MKWLAAGMALAMVSCETKEPVPPEQAQTIAREAAQEAFQQLTAELAKAIESGGPVAAIPVCSTKAQSLVSEVSCRRNVAMIRLSDRPRNPRQAAEGADLAAMTKFRDAIKRGQAATPLVEDSTAGATVVRLPVIASQPLCLKCHGSAEDIAPETRAAILAVYPDDKATGYQLNDLRGIWRITVSPQPPP
ncbi:MAG: Tll0287-like domain-containing protein [Luteolibacter sp.]